MIVVSYLVVFSKGRCPLMFIYSIAGYVYCLLGDGPKSVDNARDPEKDT